MSAVIDIRRLKTGSSHQEFELDESDLHLDSPDVVKADGCRVNVDIEHTNDEIIIRGEVSADLKLECARCLEPFDTSSVFQLALVVKLTRGGRELGPEGESSDDYFVVSDTTDEFDLAPIVAERVVLSLPLKPLCSEDCQGLCPNCGANRNVESCECTNGFVDERFSALAKLKEINGGN
jgi:uncharacterized protein